MKMGRAKFLIWVLFSIFFAGTVIAAEPAKILSNSEDWRDVYSTVLYGNLIGKSASFLVSDRHATLILNSIQRNSHIWAISSKKVPYVVGYKNLLESRGYTAEEFAYDNANLEIAKRLEGISSFIIIDDSYGYNAISVAPYAIATKSYVLFGDKNNIKDVDKFLESIKVDKILVYGNVDREVKAALSKYAPEIINKEGDRFLNNIEIVKKYQEIKHQKQAILTNGEFIEQEIMSGAEPVLFIGTNNVPDVVRDYVKNSDIDVGVLIGNELVGTATFIRRQMGISVFVKFAQGARAPQGAISQVEALDMFYLPVYSLNLEVDSIKYNKATNNLEVTLKNTESQAVYAIGTYALTSSDGARQTVGDVGAIFIDANELKTITYDVETMADGDINVDVFIIYGESKGSLEKEIRKGMQAQTVRVLDECDIKVNEVAFNTRNKNFYVSVENTGNVDCYVDLELIDIVIAGEKNIYGLDDVAHLGSAGKKSLKVKVENMEEEDLEDNQKVKVRAFYGERENALVRVIEGAFDVILEGIDYLFYSLIIVIIILVALVGWKMRTRKKGQA
ncbi:hypothetical protein HY501_01380 [Candidatus Woesearchaeota archaeon]|nr:hypothetical protein [Candidatus Woesearchaeota archaeon]